ncbi:uncharacterized protein [Palaemon carinicauda]|uniref:uncharacterized protein n=1 Tax=Palaemon carinicauda TaxID=392227 RepID=UPI0035B5C1DA
MRSKDLSRESSRKFLKTFLLSGTRAIEFLSHQVVNLWANTILKRRDAVIGKLYRHLPQAEGVSLRNAPFEGNTLFYPEDVERVAERWRKSSQNSLIQKVLTARPYPSQPQWKAQQNPQPKRARDPKQQGKKGAKQDFHSKMSFRGGKGPSGSQGPERETAPLTPKRKAPPAHPPAVVPDVPDIAPRRSALGVRAAVPVLRQGSPARPRPSAPRRPPAVPEVARKRPTAQTRPAPDIAPPRSPAHSRPVPVMAPTRPPVPQRPPVPTRPPAPRRPPSALTRLAPRDLQSSEPRYDLFLMCAMRSRSPAQLAHPQASRSVLPDRRQTSRPQVARDPAPALSRPRPVLPDTRSGALVISRPSEPHQVAARPRVRPPPVPAPDRRSPTPSPTRSRDHVPAQAAVRPRAHAPALSPARHRSIAPDHPPVRPRARHLPASRHP